MIRSALTALGLGAVLFAVLFLPEIRDGRLIAYRDAGYYHLPMSRLVSAELREGRVPYWNPVIACGTPLSANPNNYVWYPGRLLDLVFAPDVALQMHFFLHWILGGAAMAVLAVSLGASGVAAAAAAVLYLLAGPSLSLLNFANLAPFLLWTPLTMLAVRGLLLRPGPRPAAALGVCLALQTTFVEPSLLVVEMFAVLAVVGVTGLRVRPAAALGWAAVSGVVALLLAAPMWIPMLDLVRTSARGADSRAALGSSVPVVALWQLVVPQFFGDYHTLAKREFWGEFFNEGKGPFFLSISFGVTAFAAMAAALGARFRTAAPLFVAGVAGVLIAMGPHFPPLRPLLGAEGSGWFRWPVKFTFLAAVTWPLVAALGVDALRAGSRRAVVMTAAAGLVLTAGALLGGATMGSEVADGWVAQHVVPQGEVKDVPVILSEVRGRLERAGLFAALLTVGAFAVWITARRRSGTGAGTVAGSRIAAIALLVLMAVELAPPQRDVYRGTPREILNLDTPILQAAREVASEGYRVHFPRAYWDVSVPPRPDLPDEWWPRTRLDRELGNFYHPIGEGVPMVLLNPDRLIRQGAAERGRTYPLMRRSGQEATLQLIGVAATVKAGQPALLGDGAPVGTSAGFPVKLARDPDAIPIVSWIAERPVVKPPLWGEQFVEDARRQWTEKGNPSAVRLVDRHPGYWAVDVDASSSGWVTLSESAYPGWTARVDGEPVSPEPYLEDFLAVEVSAGPHRVEWNYRPPHQTLWLLISLAGLLVVAGLARVGRTAAARTAPSAVPTGKSAT